MTMSDVIVVMRDGRIQQQGSPEELYERPLNRFVAAFIGQSNAITGRLIAIDLASRFASVETAAGLVLRGHLTDLAARPAVGDPVEVAVRPERLDLAAREVDAVAGWTTVTGRIRQGTYLGDQTEYRVDTDLGQLVARQAHHGRADTGSVGPGEAVTVRWPDAANLVLVA